MSVHTIWNANEITLTAGASSVTLTKALRTLISAEVSYEEIIKSATMKSGKIRKRSLGFRTYVNTKLLYAKTDMLNTFITLIGILNATAITISFGSMNAGDFIVTSKVQLEKISTLISAGDTINLEFEAISLVSAIPTDHATT